MIFLIRVELFYIKTNQCSFVFYSNKLKNWPNGQFFNLTKNTKKPTTINKIKTKQKQQKITKNQQTKIKKQPNSKICESKKYLNLNTKKLFVDGFYFFWLNFKYLFDSHIFEFGGFLLFLILVC